MNSTLKKSFSNELEFLCNFSKSPFIYQGKLYPTAEHAYQAAKFLDQDYAEKVRMAATPAIAKKLGRQGLLREDWDSIKYSIMKDILSAKFSDASLKSNLLNTGDLLLEEGNYWHDNVWGNCYCPKCRDIPGQNLLGRILMELREKFVAEMK